ncbi:MAG: hypothetical protein PHQ65_05305 [Bacteroidales bacterium]|jgi:hypothetical protein|nr:hypothetical protein [Bacteroidales bacterium]MDD3664660.1 hypothetical protein [Bacteroidales bacterium]
MKSLRIFLVLLVVPLLVIGQQRTKDDKRFEEIKAQKVAFITSKLDLSPAEAQEFWPVYNEYSQKKEDIHKERFGQKRKAKPLDVDQLSDEEAARILDEMVADQEKMAAIEKEYSLRFRKLLPVKKVLKLYEAEMEFKKMLLDRIKDHRPERGRP